ncbi:MFS transporter [Lentzea tibetensis]|uniref:MFS transporter n=1 Tax=Lentzea tibetensis TaxID=2591470 RepID=A0A563ERK1_9PSEU|nr:MFS transporter [Lentzea tibetensis]TWP50273.1 MFS transporter [Lentzea tibetensis]
MNVKETGAISTADRVVRRVPRLSGLSPATAASNVVGMTSYLALSVWVLQTSHSYFLSAAVFGCQWVVPLLWPPAIARLTARGWAGAVAARSEWCAAALSLVLAGVVHTGSVTAVLVLVMARGLCDSVTRASAALVVKVAAESPAEVERVVSRIELWRIVGTSSAGVLFAVFAETVSVSVLLVAAGLVLCATGLVYRVVAPAGTAPRPEEPAAGSILAGLREQPLVRAWLWQLGLVAAFQGLHNAIRVAYPEQQLGAGVAGVGVVSAVSTLGVVAGGWLASRENVTRLLARVPEWALVLAVATTAAAAVLIPAPVPSYAAYFVFMVLFEFAFMRFNLAVVTSTDVRHAPAVLSLRATLLSGSTLAGLVLTSGLLSVMSVAASTAVAGALLAILSGWRHVRARADRKM